MKKRLLATILVFALIISCCLNVNAADGNKQSGLFFYSLKGNGSAVITGFDWRSNNNEDIYIPRLIDGYTVTEIGAYAFSNDSVGYSRNDSLKFNRNGIGQSVVVVIPETVKIIGEKAFFCSNTTSVSIPASVELIGSGAFAGCVNISRFAVDSGNQIYTTIDGALYNKTKKELVAYPIAYDVTHDFYFSHPDIIIPQGIESIGDYALYGVAIGANNDFSIPSSVKKIGAYSFAYAQMGRFKGFASVEEIGDHAFTYSLFNWCEIGKSSVRSIGESAFEYIRYEYPEGDRPYTFNLPSTLNYLGKNAFKDIQYKDSLWQYSRIDLSRTKLTSIPEYAFSGFRLTESRTNGLEPPTIILPSSITDIMPYAFEYVGDYSYATDITIPPSVERIHEYAFTRTPLAISFGNDSKLVEISDNAFYSSYIVNKTVELPEGLLTIGNRAFYSNGEYTLAIPASVTSIGNDFCDRSTVTLKVEAGSYAALYASENGYPTSGNDDTSWLND